MTAYSIEKRQAAFFEASHKEIAFSRRYSSLTFSGGDMSKLNVDQQSVNDLFRNKKSDFLIPDYQRPYAWTEEECQTLWDDLFSFAFPDNDYSKFNRDDEYFLGPIVTYVNSGKMEVIDGQQRLTTLMLLLRAFYRKFSHMKDEESLSTKESIEKCLWKTNEFGKPDMDALKIDSEVATDRDKDEFLMILRTGEAQKEQKSNYAVNYRFFQNRIDNFLNDYPSYFPYFPTRILNNCILLPIEAESQDTALRIFSTLNDRGKPLSDADIFKAQFYKFFSALGQKEYFIKQWKGLEELCEKIFHPTTGTPMDELFTRYMYYERAKLGIKSSTTEALRKFYERNEYKILKNKETLDNLAALAHFWNDVANQNIDRFSTKILRKLFVLNYAPNGMWTYIVSVYFMKNRDEDGMLNEDLFFIFLDKITAFIWTYTVTNPGVNALRPPIYAEMANIVNGTPVSFSEYKFDAQHVKNAFSNFNFLNGRPITKSMLTWWAYQNNRQDLLSLESMFEIEHIFARNRQEKEKGLRNAKNMESLGNKALLEKRINIRASDYRFSDKKKYYLGFINNKNQKKEGTKLVELIDLAGSFNDFVESDIQERCENILDTFMEYLSANDLTQ